MYPTKYAHIDHDSFKDMDVKNKAAILFLSKNNVSYHPEETLKLMENVNTAKEFIIVFMEDLDGYWKSGKLKEHERYDLDEPLEYHFDKIDAFLRHNKDLEVIASCSAGVSRSGFVTWWLDFQNGNADDAEWSEDEYGIYFHAGKTSTRKRGYFTNGLLTKYALQSVRKA